MKLTLSCVVRSKKLIVNNNIDILLKIETVRTDIVSLCAVHATQSCALYSSALLPLLASGALCSLLYFFTLFRWAALFSFILGVCLVPKIFRTLQ